MTGSGQVCRKGKARLVGIPLRQVGHIRMADGVLGSAGPGENQ
jgi:hypothetical protein